MPKIRSPLPSNNAHDGAHHGAVARASGFQANNRMPETTIGIHTMRNRHRVSNNQLTAAAPRPIGGHPLVTPKLKQIASLLGTRLKAEPASRERIPELADLL